MSGNRRIATEVRAIPVQFKSTTMWVRTDINGNAHKLFSAIGLKIPPKVLKLDKTQNPSGTNSNAMDRKKKRKRLFTHLG